MSNETEKNLFYENKNQYSSLSETDKKNMAAVNTGLFWICLRQNVSLQ